MINTEDFNAWLFRERKTKAILVELDRIDAKVHSSNLSLARSMLSAIGVRLEKFIA